MIMQLNYKHKEAKEKNNTVQSSIKNTTVMQQTKGADRSSDD